MFFKWTSATFESVRYFCGRSKKFFFFMNEAGLVAAWKLKKKPDATEF